jgi:hypothetical protein
MVRVGDAHRHRLLMDRVGDGQPFGRGIHAGDLVGSKGVHPEPLAHRL